MDYYRVLRGQCVGCLVCTPVFLQVQRLCSRQGSRIPHFIFGGRLSAVPRCMAWGVEGPIGFGIQHAHPCSCGSMITGLLCMHADESGEAG
jgi:hypothetical protein